MHRMALAIVVTLEKQLSEPFSAYSKAASGKALAREIERLDLAARTVKTPAITSFLSESQAVLIEQLKADGFDPSKMRLPPEHWFAAGEGLRMIRALVEHIIANLNHFRQPNPLVRELKAVETLLFAAETAGVRFHFTRMDV